MISRRAVLKRLSGAVFAFSALTGFGNALRPKVEPISSLGELADRLEADGVLDISPKHDTLTLNFYRVLYDPITGEERWIQVPEVTNEGVTNPALANAVSRIEFKNGSRVYSE